MQGSVGREMSGGAEALTRRGLLRLGLGISTTLVAHSIGIGTARSDSLAKLFVFVPSDMAIFAFQKLMSSALPDADIVAFGRYRDFESSLADRPDAVLTLQPVIEAKQLKAAVTGSMAGSMIEPCALVAVGKAVEAQSLDSVGIVDILGHKGMKDLVSRIVGSSPRVERVTKNEDLLPLLQFSTVDAVVLPERLVASLQARSKLDLRATRTVAGLGLPALSIMTPAGASLVDKFRKLSGRANQEMGVARWE